jgi:hypothetical protein
MNKGEISEAEICLMQVSLLEIGLYQRCLSLVGFLEKEENSPPPIAQKGKKSVETDFCCYDRKKSRSVVRRKNHVSPSAIIAVDGNRVNGL